MFAQLRILSKDASADVGAERHASRLFLQPGAFLYGQPERQGRDGGTRGGGLALRLRSDRGRFFKLIWQRPHGDGSHEGGTNGATPSAV